MSKQHEPRPADHNPGTQTNGASASVRETAVRHYSARRRWKRILSAVRVIAVLLVVAVTSIPVAWIFFTSLKSQGQCLHDPPIWIPSDPKWSNFAVMLADGGARNVANSLIVTVGGTLIAVAGGLLVAYSVSRFRTGGQNLVNWVLSIKFLPPIAFALPISMMFATLKLIDTHLGLILVYAAFNMPFVVWTMKGFMDEVPAALDEAAMIDGCSRLGVMWRIVFPLSAPGLVSTTLLTFVFIWSEFLFALVLGQHELFTIPVRLAMYYSDAVGWRCAPQAALATVAILPMIAMALFGQRYIVRAMTFGAVKE